MMNLTEILIKHNDPVTRYAVDVIQGKIISGKTEKLICKRHIKDLKRQDKEEFPFIFDYSIAEQGIIKFTTKYCKFTDGKLQGQDVEIVDFQYFIFGSIFGWVHNETGFRRFNQAYIQIARKNGKTLMIGWIALFMLIADGYFGSQVYTSANSKDQARLCWEACDRTLKNSKALKKRLKVVDSRSIIHYKKKYSFIKALSSDTKNLDGFDPHCGVIDEYHAHRTNQVYKLLDDGTVQQDESLIFIITTAGFDLDVPCFSEYNYCKEILEGKKDNEHRFIFISEMDDDDDVKDPENWLKANPLFRHFEDGIEKLGKKVKEGLDNQSHLRNMLTKTLNKWVDMKVNGYMELKKWLECKVNKKDLYEIVKGKQCYCGVDLSQKHDLSSAFFVFPLGSDQYAVLGRTFIPGSRVKQKEVTDGVPYQMWIDAGWMIACEGMTIRNADIEKFIDDFSKEYDFEVLEIDYDNYSANQLAQNMESRGHKAVEIRQGKPTLSEPTKDFRLKVYEKNILHENNPVLNWNVNNAVETSDRNGNIQLDKSDLNKKIDGLASVINACVRAFNHEFNEDKQIDVEQYATKEFLDKIWG